MSIVVHQRLKSWMHANRHPTQRFGSGRLSCSVIKGWSSVLAGRTARTSAEEASEGGEEVQYILVILDGSVE